MGWLMSQHVKPLAEELGMQRIHWHALRHLNNSLMMNDGVDVPQPVDPNRPVHALIVHMRAVQPSDAGPVTSLHPHYRRQRHTWFVPHTSHTRCWLTPV